MKEKKINEIENEAKEISSTVQIELETMEKILDDGFTGLITRIVDITNRDFFDSDKFEERMGFAITINIDGPDGTCFDEWYNKPDVRGLQSSNVWDFRQKYGCYPKVGLAVVCHIDESGYFKITR